MKIQLLKSGMTVRKASYGYRYKDEQKIWQSDSGYEASEDSGFVFNGHRHDSLTVVDMKGKYIRKLL